ncbi:MAG: type IV toxin-antitoxin system AbiEi family antitoxin [Dysgonamonadaceae bacterium]|jgi:predicted transcriptional regulator of viral defense system|nr:type IV toxin-antitoxin system AbiEi family antitoxin [Dysgonamonadaceae bacterium]
MADNRLDIFLKHIRAKGRYTFTFDELKKNFDLSDKALRQSMFRLQKKNEIAVIRQGFYVIIPPEYASTGTLPETVFIDSLMKFLGKIYYVGLLSAAALHGAAHQKPMTDYVVCQHPAPRNINNKKQRILFFSKQTLIQEGIVQKKTISGFINVSSPELTAFDLLDNIKKFGINRITTVLQELHEEMRPSRLSKIAKLVDNRANIQRLGYILETVIGAEAEKLTNVLYKILSKTTFVPVPLSPVKTRHGTINKKWKIIENMQIEPDL